MLILLSIPGCGQKKDLSTGQKMRSFFDFFNSSTEASTQGTTEPSTNAQGGGGGDQVVDPPEIDTNKYADTENEELNKLFDDYFKDDVTSSTLAFRNVLADGSKYGVSEPSPATWGEIDYSDEAIAKDKAELEDWIKKLEAIDVDTLTEKQRFDYDYLLDNLKNDLIGYENPLLRSEFAPMRGLQSNLPSVFTDYEFRNKQDVQNYLDLMNDIPEITEASLEYEKKRVDAGYGMEDSLINKVISQCDEILDVSGEHFMITTFNNSIDGLSFLTDEEKQEFKEKNKEAVEKSFLPGYEKIKTAFTGFLGKNKVKGGLCQYEDHGKEFYAATVRSYSGSAKTPQEMIEYMDQKKKKLDMQIAQIKAANPEAISAYYSVKDTMFDYMADMDAQEVVKYLMDHAMDEFPEVGEIKYVVKPLDSSLEQVRENTVAYYSIPVIDRDDDNLIRVNGKSKDSLYETLAHEGCPGHMYQVNYYRKTNPNPVRCLNLDLGYMEGWAVYASYETMKKCDLNGIDNAKEIALISNLESQIGYYYHGRIDLGVNYEGWLIDDVKKFLRENGLKEEIAETLYIISVGDPGVYLSYSESYFEMQDLRDYAEQELGSKFNAVEYHKAILEAGPCPYDLLKKRVDKYILENQ